MRMLPIILIIFIATEAFSDELLEAQQKVLAPFSNHPQYKPLENKLTTLSTELDSINKQLQLLTNRTNTFIPRVEKAQSAEEFKQLCIDILKNSIDKSQFIARINEIVIEGSLLIYQFLADAMQDTLLTESPNYSAGNVSLNTKYFVEYKNASGTTKVINVIFEKAPDIQSRERILRKEIEKLVKEFNPQGQVLGSTWQQEEGPLKLGKGIDFLVYDATYKEIQPMIGFKNPFE